MVLYLRARLQPRRMSLKGSSFTVGQRRRHLRWPARAHSTRCWVLFTTQFQPKRSFELRTFLTRLRRSESGPKTMLTMSNKNYFYVFLCFITQFESFKEDLKSKKGSGTPEPFRFAFRLLIVPRLLCLFRLSSPSSGRFRSPVGACFWLGILSALPGVFCRRGIGRF